MVKPVQFAHVVYMTRRYDEMIAWYESVFEAKVVYRNPAMAFMTYDDEHHRFAFANLDVMRPEGAGPDDRGEIGVNHVAYTYATAGDLLETYAQLRQAGILPYWPIHHGVTLSLSLYNRDPTAIEWSFRWMWARRQRPTPTWPATHSLPTRPALPSTRRNCWPAIARGRAR